jgi:hypothetical protein
MKRSFRLGSLVVAAAAAVPLGAAHGGLLPGLSGGIWEISRSANGSNPVRICAPDPATLAQFEHRGSSCTRVVISQSHDEAVIHYTCARGGFGQSKMTLITPRVLRVETQGLSNGLPFAYVLHARFVGSCPAR